MIQFTNNMFYLSGNNFSYVFSITEFGYLRSIHCGKSVSIDDLSYLSTDIERGFCATTRANQNEDRKYSLDSMPNEYPQFGNGDFRQPAITYMDSNKVRQHDFRYFSHEILKNKPEIKSMPSISDGETLVVSLKSDTATLKLYYTIYENQDAITKRAEIINDSNQPFFLERLMSTSIDLPVGDYQMGILHGKHTGECHFERSDITHGISAISSTRGSGNHQYNPFFCVMEKTTTETSGMAIGFNLVYGGNFLASAEKDQTSALRLQMGINPFDFSFEIDKGQSFTSPECVITYSSQGLTKMSQNFHDLYRSNLLPKQYVHASRPIVVNNWEATYFWFDTQKLFEMIDNCKGTGIDTFVLDDGWFGKRNGDKSGLGDWIVNTEKLTGGLTPVIAHCKKHGMKFGLWFEPEMVNPDSDLYKAHPDWCIHTNGIAPTLARDQLVLDLSRHEVREYIKSAVSAILKSHDIDYVKWDFNRNITDSYDKALCHKFILGFYDIAEYLTKTFPDILFEGCSGGGGRVDPAMLHYFPQIWTSDCTDAYERTKIQYGTSMCYPLSSMSSHVSVCPNHQTLRTTPLKTRIDIATTTSFGYELNPNIFTLDEKVEIANANAHYRKDEELIQKGDLYRLKSPFDGNCFAFMLVSKDKKRAKLTHFTRLAIPNPPIERLHLHGLDENVTYHILELNITASGKTLQNAGIPVVPVFGDFITFTLTIESV